MRSPMTPRFIAGLCLALGLLVAAPVLAATSMNFHLDRLAILLDAHAPQAAREAAFAACKKDSLSGDIAAQYFVGNLYRLGDRLPGNIVARDPDQAFRYLSNAGAHGFIIAMAKTAELELELKNPNEAMLWAQLYGHYQGYADARVDAANHRERVGGYYANLLRRAYLAFGDDDRRTQAMKADYQAFIAQHDADISRGLALGNDARARVDQPGEKPPPKMYLSSTLSAMPQHAQDDLAEFVVEIAPDGKVRQALLFDTVPDLAMGRELRQVAMRVHADAEPESKNLRYAWLPVQLNGFGNERVITTH